jgi:hypothetical protein
MEGTLLPPPMPTPSIYLLLRRHKEDAEELVRVRGALK